jgi:transcriptional regulator with XRE-family HTH domain
MPRLRLSLVLKKVLGVRTRENSSPRIAAMSNDAPMTLRDVAQAALAAHPGVSGRQLERLAKKRGLTISYTTINHLAAGTYKSRPSRKTLEALADLSGLDVEGVYRAAGEPLPRLPLRDDLPPDADLLDGTQRRLVVEMVRTFAQQNRQLATLRAGQREDVMGNAEHPAPTSNIYEIDAETHVRMLLNATDDSIPDASYLNDAQRDRGFITEKIHAATDRILRDQMAEALEVDDEFLTPYPDEGDDSISAQADRVQIRFAADWRAMFRYVERRRQEGKPLHPGLELELRRRAKDSRALMAEWEALAIRAAVETDDDDPRMRAGMDYVEPLLEEWAGDFEAVRLALRNHLFHGFIDTDIFDAALTAAARLEWIAGQVAEEQIQMVEGGGALGHPDADMPAAARTVAGGSRGRQRRAAQDSASQVSQDDDDMEPR